MGKTKKLRNTPAPSVAGGGQVAIKEDELNPMDFVKAEEELQRLKQEHGIAEEPRKWWVRVGDWVASNAGKRERVSINRHAFCWLALLLGTFGAQRFYTRQYFLGILALLFCWSFIPWIMAIIDIMVALPMKPDENGRIEW